MMANLPLIGLIFLSFTLFAIPDVFLGAAWPSIAQNLSLPLSHLSFLTVTLSISKICASYCSENLRRRFGEGKVLFVSTIVTAIAVLGFSAGRSLLVMLLWCIPYGFASGGATTAINKYVAMHYESRHMNWLHFMWGVGSSVGPHVIAYAVAHGSWRSGYLCGTLLVFILAGLFGGSMPRWKRTVTPGENAAGKALSFMQALRLPGVLAAMAAFFCYSALEQGTALWAASYLSMSRGLDLAAAAQGAGMFYIGIAVGRALSGFISCKLNDDRMVLLGQGSVLAGVCLLLLGDIIPAAVALLLIGLGCAPMNPSLLHSIPGHFGRSQAQAIMAALMTVSHAGSMVMTPVFGWIARFTGVGIYPWFLLCILTAMFSSHRFLCRYNA